MIIAPDTECTGLHPYLGDKPFSIGICYEDETTDYVKVQVDPFNRQPLWNNISHKIIDELQNSKIDKVFANKKYDIVMLDKIGIKVRGRCEDVLIAAKVCYNLEEKDRVGLKPLAKKHINFPDDDQKLLQKVTVTARSIGKKRGYKIADEVGADYWLVDQIFPGDTHCEIYCRNDCLRALRLWYFYKDAMDAFNVRHIYERELELSGVIQEAEKEGIKLNKNRTREKVFELTTDIVQIESELHKQYGNFNINSPQQLSHILKNKVGIPLVKETAASSPEKRQYSCGVPILRQFKQYPVVDKLLQRSGYNTGRKHLLTYLDCVDENDIIHGSMNQLNTATFRLSATDPNLQNVPNAATSSGEYVVDCREVFIPKLGKFFLIADYGQVELRIFAYRSGGPLLEAFKLGRDPHNETRVRLKFLSEKEPGIGRKLAKNTNFTLINVGGPGVLFTKYDIPLEQASIIHKEFHEAYPETRQRWTEISNFAKQHTYIINAFGRKLFIDPDFYYRATSYDIQSSAADLIKIAMIQISKFFKKNEIKGKVLLQIHDELVIELDEQYKDDMILFQQIKDIMENNYGCIGIPTIVDMKRSFTNWGDKEELKFTNIAA